MDPDSCEIRIRHRRRARLWTAVDGSSTNEMSASSKTQTLTLFMASVPRKPNPQARKARSRADKRVKFRDPIDCGALSTTTHVQRAGEDARTSPDRAPPPKPCVKLTSKAKKEKRCKDPDTMAAGEETSWIDRSLASRRPLVSQKALQPNHLPARRGGWLPLLPRQHATRDLSRPSPVALPPKPSSVSLLPFSISPVHTS